jgi:hypothetical protein
MLYGELGRYPLEIVIKTHIIKFWKKIAQGHQYKYSNFINKFMFISVQLYLSSNENAVFLKNYVC